MRSITMSRRRAVLVTVAAGALAVATGATATATTQPPPSSPPGTETASSAAGGLSIGGVGGSVAPNPDIAQGLNIYYIPKDTQNPYEVIADQGGQEALQELGGKVVSSAPRTPAAAQIPSIQAAIQAHADAIVIAGNDPAALCPALGQALAAGVTVVTFDSDTVTAGNLFINQADTADIAR